MTEYARPLWLGGGISYEALEIVEMILLTEIAENAHPANLKTELHNLANAARAEIQRRSQPKCDLI
jgi:hypothetical protein